MAVTVVASVNSSLSATRSPTSTFSSWTPALNDLVILFVGSSTQGQTVTEPSGWVNVLGAGVDVETDANQCSAIYHWVTSGEASGGTLTYTATNFFGANTSGGTLGVVLRGVDTTTPIDSAASGFNSGDTTTPHVFPALTGTNLVSNSLVLGYVYTDSNQVYSTAPTGWTFVVKNTAGQNGRAVCSRDTLTTVNTNVTATNITPATADEYVAITVAFQVAGVAPKTGTGSGDYTWAGTASGKRTPKGTDDGAYTWAGTTAGSRTSRGTGTGAYTWAGTAAGSRTSRGTGTGAYTWAGSATGSAPAGATKTGTGTGDYTWAGSATGVGLLGISFVGVNGPNGNSGRISTPAATCTVTGTLPTGTAAGDRVYIFQSQMGTTPGIGGSWTELYRDRVVGTGTGVPGSGLRMESCHYRDYDGVWTMPTIGMDSSTNIAQHVMVMTLRKSVSETWNTPTVSNTASDYGTADTSFSTTSSSFTTTTNGWVIAHALNNDGVRFGSATLTGTNGFTHTGFAERCDGGSTGDVGGAAFTTRVTAGVTGTLTLAVTLASASEGGTTFFQQTVSGATTAAGTGSGSYTWAGTAAGDTPPNRGTSSGTYTWAGTAVGDTPPNRGTSSGAYTWAGAATGDTPPNRGTSSGAYTWAGAATGDTPPNRGTSTGAYTWAGSAVGARTSRGATTGTYTWAGTAAGSAPTVGAKTGVGAGSYTWAGTAAGSRASRGTGTGAYTWAGTAAGSRTSSGVGAGSYTWAGTAVGAMPVSTAPPTVVGYAVAGAASGTSLTFNKSDLPTLLDGDYLVAFLRGSTSSTSTLYSATGFTLLAPASYTVDASGRLIGAHGHVVATASSEPSTWTFTFTGTGGRNAGILLLLRGVDTANPVSGFANGGTQYYNHGNFGGGWTTTVDSLILAAAANEVVSPNSSTPTVVDSDYTTVAVQPHTSGTGVTRTVVWVGSKTATSTTAPSSGNTTWASTSSLAYWSISLAGLPVSATTEGAATGTYTWAGTAVGDTPPNRGTATGTYTWAGTAAGQRTSRGAATGAYTWVGTAVGDTPPNRATATGAYTWTGSTAGSRTSRGTASGSYTWAGTATGVAPIVGAKQGTCAGSYNFTGTAAGRHTSRGTSSGTYTWAGSAAGSRASRGTASGSYTWAGTATGAAPIVEAKQGSATGTYTWAGSAAGKRTPRATSSGAYTWVGSTRGVHPGFHSVAAALTYPGATMAHRGASGVSGMPEMSERGYDYAVGRGYGILEFSANRTSDGVWVGCHDADLNRTSQTSGLPNISTQTWATVQTFTNSLNSGGTPAPYWRLEDFLDKYTPTHVVFADPKFSNSGTDTTAFLNLLDAHGGPTKIVVKYFGVGAGSNAIADAATARGYQTWGYYYEADYTDGDMATNQSHWSVLGMEVFASAAAWAAVLSYGKPVVAHIASSQAGYNTAVANGADIVQCSRPDLITAVSFSGNCGMTTGAYAWTGTATGIRPIVGARQGTAAGSYNFTGTASGTHTSRGTASGTYTWAGAAAGTHTSRGTTSGSYTWGGTTAGSRTSRGTASGTYTWAGTAAGSRTSRSTASGTYNFTGTATGSRTPRGTASGVYTWTGTATGVKPVVGAKQGTAAGSYAWAGAAAGKHTPRGTGSGAYTWTGIATGVKPVVGAKQGTAAGSYNFTGSAAGARSSRGATVAAYGWDGAAIGWRVSRSASSGAYTWTGTATGDTPPNRGVAGVGVYGWVGTATGDTPPNRGSTVGTYKWAGLAISGSVRVGEASGSYSWTGRGWGILTHFSAERMLIVAAEDRTLIVEAEDRALIVEAEDRTLTVATEDRTLVVAAEDRTLAVEAENQTLVVAQ